MFYIVPRPKVDALLPIAIHPAPQQLVRVFVGRIELLSPSMRSGISTALSIGDVSVLQKYGRFLNAFLREMGNGNERSLVIAEPAQRFLDGAYNQAIAESNKLTCVN